MRATRHTFAGARSRRRPRREGGAVMIVVACALILLLGVIGLAIDAGMGYMIRARLDAATDGAVVAAAEAVTRGSNQSEQTASAQQAAAAFFTANYPQGFLGSTATGSTPTVVFNVDGTVTIDMNGEATVPVSFMKLLGFNLLDIRVASETIRRTLDMAFVVDTTGSLTSSAAAVRANAVSFLNNFDVTNDRVALMHFAFGTTLDVPFKGNARGFDRDTMTSIIKKYNFSGSTNSVEGMWTARNQLNTVITQPSSLRVIVFFSDGSPNSFSSAMPSKLSLCNNIVGTISTEDTPGNLPFGLYSATALNQVLALPCYSNTASNVVSTLPKYYNAHGAADTSLPIWPVSGPRAVTSGAVSYVNVNRTSRNLLEAIANQARQDGTYVFTLGYGAILRQPQGADNEYGEDLLKCMANTPDSLSRCYNPKQPVGVYCYAATDADIKPCFSKLASQILRISK